MVLELTPENTNDFWDLYTCVSGREIVKSLQEEGYENILFSQGEHLGDALRYASEQNQELVVVVGNSDFGLCYQKEYHPNSDLRRTALYGVDWRMVDSKRDIYLQVPVGPACNLKKCDPAHKYILRMERWSEETFDQIPENVKLYSSNLNVVAPNMFALPFGLIYEDRGRKALQALMRKNHKTLSSKKSLNKHGLYVNFQPHTEERLLLLERFKQLSKVDSRITYRENVPVEQYLEEISEHECVLCPPGNGLDCYRTYETILLGSYPVMRADNYVLNLSSLGLPIVAVMDFDFRPQDFFPQFEDWKKSLQSYVSVLPLLDSYWKEKFKQACRACRG